MRHLVIGCLVQEADGTADDIRRETVLRIDSRRGLAEQLAVTFERVLLLAQKLQQRIEFPEQTVVCLLDNGSLRPAEITF
ncbi:hypothetical protein D3C73_856410 [compost metagenome]